MRLRMARAEITKNGDWPAVAAIGRQASGLGLGRGLSTHPATKLDGNGPSRPACDWLLYTSPRPTTLPPVPPTFDFHAFDAVLLDLDGTVYFEEHALPGAVELIRQLQTQGRPYACLTNSTSSPERISARLERMGVIVDPAHIYTAAAAACDYVMERFAGQSAVRGAVDASRSPRVFK